MKRILGLPLFFLLVVGVVLLSALPSGYYLITPGGSYEIDPQLNVPPEYREEMGRLAFTAVLAQPSSWAEVVTAQFDDEAEAVPQEEVVPREMSREEFNEINRRLIEESKLVAAVVGLQAAGYDARVTGQGAEVVALLEGMPAEAVLLPEDVIVAVDGQPVDTAISAVEAIRRHQVGDEVQLTIIRNGEQQPVTVGTKNSPTEPGRPLIGASITTRLFDVVLPFPIEIDTQNVGGSSAGMMFSLGILDAVTDGLLTRGYYVAGTGTISADGEIGPIGGANLKVIAAERAGAQVFLVPRENYEEAQEGAREIRLIPVETFSDAVQALCGLEPLPEAAALPPPCTGL